MHPVLLDWGPLTLRSFGLMLALAFLAGSMLVLREARARGLDEGRIVNLIVTILVCSVLGARLFYVATHASEFAGRWGHAFAVWEGGLTLYGGLAAGIVAGTLFVRRSGLPFGPTADAVAPAIALGNGIARVGCYLNGCCYGRPADPPWGVHFPHGSLPDLQFPDQAVLPAQLYNAAAGFALFALLWLLRGRLRPGQLWWTFLLLFTLLRVPLDAARYYEPGAYVVRWAGGGLTDSALVGLVLAVIAVVFLVRARRGPRVETAWAPTRAAS